MDTLQHLWKAESHLSEEGIALFVDALKLKKFNKLPQTMRAHVAGCQICKTEIMELYALVEKQEYSDEPHPFLSSSRNTLPILYRIAAIFLFLLGVGVLAYFLNGRGTTKPDLTLQPGRDSVQQTTGNKERAPEEDLIRSRAREKSLIAENFEVSPNLEDLVGGTIRSGDITVYSPRNGEVPGQKIVFRWAAGDGRKPMILQILTNKEKAIHRAEIKDSLYIFQKKRLSPGLYYWKLLDKDELVYVGKFFIR